MLVIELTSGICMVLVRLWWLVQELLNYEVMMMLLRLVLLIMMAKGRYGARTMVYWLAMMFFWRWLGRWLGPGLCVGLGVDGAWIYVGSGWLWLRLFCWFVRFVFVV